jgi:class 3 adenylate cyclase
LKRTSLRRTILIYVSTLLVVLIVAMLGVVNYLSESFVGDSSAKELSAGSERVIVAEAQRIQGLSSSANLVASLSGVKALLEIREAHSLRDSLKDKDKDGGFMPAGVDLLIALDKDDRLIARTDISDPDPIPALNRPGGILQIGDDLYHFASAASATSDVKYGTIIAAAKLDDEFAKTLRVLTGSDVVLIGAKVIGTTLQSNRLPFQKRKDWETSIPLDDASHPVDDARGAEYLAQAVVLGDEASVRPLAVILKSHDEAMQPFRTIQYVLFFLGVVVAGAGIAGSALLAKNVTAPVAKLVEGMDQVAAGNFDHRIEIESRDEIGALADSFNTMIVGLRERADMQKFVSQSTVDMIQASSSKKVSAGERVTLTILFSDMRGFTAMSENRPPEEIVRILNECLSLQAAKVKKFGGDIDKFVGDCVVALFTGEDMELKAIRCAVEIHKSILERNAAHPADYPIQVGVGIATGEVILGSIGSEDRLDYTVIGSHVNLCSRICSLAGPRETLMAQSTYERVEGLVAAERLEPVQVKGFKEPVPLYRMAVKAPGKAHAGGVQGE